MCRRRGETMTELEEEGGVCSVSDGFQWVGTGIPMNRRNTQQLQYDSLLINDGTYINVTDFIMVANDDSTDPADHFVAQVLKFYDRGPGRPDPKRTIVRWYIRPFEIPPRKLEKARRQTPACDLNKQEVFLYTSALPEDPNQDIDAETIIGKCHTYLVERDETLTLSSAVDGDGRPVFFVRRSYNGSHFKDLIEPPATKTPKQRTSKRKDAVTENKENSSARWTTGRATRRSLATKLGSKSATKPSKDTERRGTRKSLGADFDTAARPSDRPAGRRNRRGDQAEDSASPGLTRAISRLNLSPLSPDTVQTGISPFSPNRSLGRDDVIDMLDDVIDVSDDDDVSGEDVAVGDNGDVIITPVTTGSAQQRSSTTPAVTTPVVLPPRVLRPRSTPAMKTDTSHDITKSRDITKSCDITKSPDSSKEKPILKRKSSYSTSLINQSDSSEDDFQVTPMKSSKKVTFSSRKNISSRSTKTKTPKKTSQKSTPSKYSLKNATPCLPVRATPKSTMVSPLEKARVRLHVSAVPETLPCRENEFRNLYTFIEGKILEGNGGCMYVSGVPGTGKTATVHEVVRCLEECVGDGELSSFQYIEINAMKMTQPEQAYCQILQLLTGQKTSAAHAAEILDRRFKSSTSKHEPVVLVVDELDMLWNRKQNVMYNLFDWPSKPHSKLIVVAIANTMDLPEKVMINRVSSRLGLTRISFQPYTHKQLQEIITSRLLELNVFEEDAIEMAARKVAAVSGDARRALDICRRATELAEVSDSSNLCVMMSHVNQALNEMFQQPKMIAIREASIFQQLFLRAVVTEFRSSGLEETSFKQVFTQNSALCRLEGYRPPNTSELMAITQRLAAFRLIIIESGREDIYQRIRLNIGQDDVLYALKLK